MFPGWSPRKRLFLGLILIILIGLALRVPYLITFHSELNMDEAVLGIMAQDIINGEKLPLFFYGQEYFGPLESLVAIPFFLIFSPSTFFLRLSVLILTLAGLLLFWQGFRLMNRDSNGLVAVGWLILSPMVLCVRSIQPSGHMGGLFCGGLIFYLTARAIVFRKWAWVNFFLWGLAVGFGLWMSPATLIYAIPSGCILLLNDVRVIRYFPLSFLGCLVGAYPFWVKSLTIRFGTFNFGQTELSRQPILSLLEDIWKSVLQMNSFLGYDLLPGPISLLTWLGILILLSLSVFFFFKRPGNRFSPKGLLWLFSWMVIALTLFAYSYVNAGRFGVVSYRYYIPILVGLALIFDCVLTETRNYHSLSGSLLFIGLLAVNLWTNVQGYKNQTFLRYEVHFEAPYLQWKGLLPSLEKERITRAYTDFLDEGPLNFGSRGKIVCSHYYNSRYPRLSLVVDGTRYPAFIFRDPAEAEFFKQGLDALGSPGYSSLDVPHYKIFFNIKAPEEAYEPLDREKMQISAYPNNASAAGLLDGNMATSWSTPGPQKGSEVIAFDLGREESLSRVDLIPNWSDTLPVQVVIETSLDNREWSQAVNLKTSSTLYWAGAHPGYKVLDGFNQYIFPGRKARYVRIKQTGTHPNPWELSEIILYSSKKKERIKPLVDWESMAAFLKGLGQRRIVGDLYASANMNHQSRKQIIANVRYNAAFPELRAKWDYAAEEIQAVAVHRRDQEEVLGFLKAQLYHYQVHPFGEYSLIYALENPFLTLKQLDLSAVELKTGHNQKDLPLMIDRHRKTRWTSGTPRRDDMFIACDLIKREKVSALILDPGTDFQDVAQKLKIYSSPDGLAWKEIDTQLRFHQTLRWTGSHLIGSGTSCAYIFPALETRYLKMVCQENQPAYYWSVAELSIWGPRDRVPRPG